MKRKSLLSLLSLTLFLASCAHMEYFPPGNVQTGLASWYGPEFHGKLTSNKEIFDMNDLTAAHRTLPFGTYVMVTNLDNGKSVTVRINDRGPFVEDRIIDLSYAAAKVLDMIGMGTARVRIETLENISLQKSSNKFSVQVGSFIIKSNAVTLKNQLQSKYEDVYISLFKTTHQVYYRVRIQAKNRDSAKKLAQELVEDGWTVIILEEQ
jgi:rare lipoprotein A